MAIPPPRPAILHAVLALAATGAITVMTLLGSLSYSTASLRENRTQHIALEASASFRAFIAVAEGKRPTIVDLHHDAATVAYAIVPESWALRELRGARIDDLAVGPPALGARRWPIPPGATLSFDVDRLGTLTVQSVTGVPLQISWKRVDVVSGRVQEDTVLVKDKTVEF